MVLGFWVFVVSVTILAVLVFFGFLCFRGDLGSLWVWVLCISGFGLFWVLLVGFGFVACVFECWMLDCWV